MKASSSLKKKKTAYVCVWLIAANSLFSAHCGFKKCMMNHACPVLMFYSVSCGVSDACSIIRGRFQRCYVRSDVILRKRALCCFLHLLSASPFVRIWFRMILSPLIGSWVRCVVKTSSEGSFFNCFGLYLLDWPGLAGGIQGWFIHSGTS